MSDKREILFRGRRNDDNEWVEGSRLPDRDGCTYIIPVKDNSFGMDEFGQLCIQAWHMVGPDTICQYTGLDDKNGRKIFEGDIIVIEDEDDDGIFVVKWDTDTARFVMDADGWTADFDSYNGYDCEVIGNIFDNPELVGEGDESVSYG